MWKPIETAPRDETWIAVCDGNIEVGCLQGLDLNYVEGEDTDPYCDGLYVPGLKFWATLPRDL